MLQVYVAALWPHVRRIIAMEICEKDLSARLHVPVRGTLPASRRPMLPTQLSA